MKKILFVFYTFSTIGGMEKALIDLLRILPADRYRIDLLLMDDQGTLYSEIPATVNVLPPLTHFAPYSEALLQRLKRTGFHEIAKLREQIHEKNQQMRAQGLNDGEIFNWGWDQLKIYCPVYENYDVAIAYSDTLPLKIVAEKVQASRKIAWIHIDYKFYSCSAESQKKYFKQMDKIICVAEQNAQSLRGELPEISGKVTTLRNILPVEQIKRKAQLFYPAVFAENNFNLFTAGRLCRQKGIDLILKTVQKLDNRDQVKWYIAGSDLFSDRNYRKMADESGVADSVFFLGEVENPYPYYLNCDLYVQPSRYEGKSISVDEAKILGCPILVTNYSSACESVKDGVTGLICSMDPEDIAAKIMLLQSDWSLRNRISAGACRASVGTEDQLAPYLDLLEE